MGRAGRLEVTFVADPPELPESWTVEMHSGSRHGHSLRFLRLAKAGDLVELEEVSWDATQLAEGNSPGTARRALTTSRDCRAMVEILRLLSVLRLREISTDVDYGRDGGEWTATDSVYLAVRMLADRRSLVVEKRFAGFPTFEDQASHLPLQVIFELSDAVVRQCSNWEPVSTSGFRQCHFVSAFSYEAEQLAAGGPSWALAQTVYALSFFGNPEAIPALEVLMTRDGVAEQLRADAEAFVRDRDYWLSGTPKDPRELSAPKKN